MVEFFMYYEGLMSQLSWNICEREFYYCFVSNAELNIAGYKSLIKEVLATNAS
jgi:hypothetical protein